MNYRNTRPRERAQAPRWCFSFEMHVDLVVVLSLAESGDVEWQVRALDQIRRLPTLDRRQLQARYIVRGCA